MSQSIGVRLPDALKDELDAFAAANGVTRNAVIQIAIEDISRGNYKLDGDHLVPTEEYLDALRPSVVDDYRGLGFDNLVRLLRKKEYPDEYIKKMVDSMISTVYDMPRYNPRRVRDSDWGC